jgi:hypothetical protein
MPALTTHAEAKPVTDRDVLRGKPALSMAGLLIVEMIIGYEWLISGVVKFVRGGFPSGLADELLEMSANAAPWYRSFIQSAVIPNAGIFGYLIEISEVLAGVALLGGPFLLLCTWDRVSDRVRAAIFFATAVAAIGGTFLAINFHLANGAAHAWLIPGDAFDEGIDLDSILPAIQIVIAAVNITLFRRLRQMRARGTPSTQSPL